MFVVEYKNPYSEKIDQKKFKGKYSYENAFSYAKDRYENYYMTVSVFGYEIKAGKRTERKFEWKAIN